MVVREQCGVEVKILASIIFFVALAGCAPTYAHVTDANAPPPPPPSPMVVQQSAAPLPHAFNAAEIQQKRAAYEAEQTTKAWAETDRLREERMAAATSEEATAQRVCQAQTDLAAARAEVAAIRTKQARFGVVNLRALSDAADYVLRSEQELKEARAAHPKPVVCE